MAFLVDRLRRFVPINLARIKAFALKPTLRQRNLRALAIADKAHEYIAKLFRHPRGPLREARFSYFGLLLSRASTAERTRRATLTSDPASAR